MTGGGAVSGVEWDRRVAESCLAQFQQTTAWAAAKALQGWNAARCWLDEPARTVAAQFLWRRTRAGRFGYVSKGPVLRSEDPASMRRAIRALKAEARQLRLRAVVVQPPDYSMIGDDLLIEGGFDRKPLEAVIRATAVIRLQDDYPSRMNRQVRREARQAAREGATYRLGGSPDIGAFHALMLETCVRQGAPPNPATAEPIRAFVDGGSARNAFAFVDWEGTPVAGLWMIGYGPRLTFWKKGWRETATRLPVNSLLMVQALEWAREQGYAEVDFVGLSPGIAERLLAGGELDEQQRRSRDMFNLRLGAEPRLLPRARILWLNPVLRTLYRYFPARVHATLTARVG